MIDKRFYSCTAPFDLAAIASHLGVSAVPPSKETLQIDALASLEMADGKSICFLADAKRYAVQARHTRAGAVLVKKGDADLLPAACIKLVSQNPHTDFCKLADLFYPESYRTTPVQGDVAIHPTAKIAETAQIGFGAVIGAGVEIGADTIIGANSVIGRGVAIGQKSMIGAHCTITYALIGDRVIIQNGTSIGQDGFGFIPGERHVKIPHLGRVIIQDNVEIQANCAIDRGTMGDTIIGEGTKLDNLVHVAHNVVIGRHCFITGQCGFAGSGRLGDYVSMGGQAGVGGHIDIGSQTTIAAKALVLRSVQGGETVAGNPARNLRDWHKDLAYLSRIRKKQEAAK